MIRTINGQRYLMRDTRPMAELRALYAAFCTKFKSSLTFEQWLGQRGKIYLKLPAKGKRT